MKSENDNETNILMPRGVALWLKTYTKLTDNQIIQFTNLSDQFELYSLNKYNTSICNPILTKQLTEEIIKECENDPNLMLYNLLPINKLDITVKKKYTSIDKRKKKIFAAGWIIHEYPHINLEKLAKLFKIRISDINNLYSNIKNNSIDTNHLLNPVKNEFCTAKELQDLIQNK